MRILYVGPLKDFSGYATAARGYVRALHAAGADIVTRSVTYDLADPGSEYKETELEHELSRRSLEGIDVFIQHVTPNEMRPRGGVFNIAITTTETAGIPEYWAKRLNQFQLVMTFSDVAVKAFEDSGVTVPVVKVPHCFDIESYNRTEFEPLELDGVDLDDKFVFYSITQMGHKKGLDLLLRAYYRAFQGVDDVVLLLKTYINMGNRQNEVDKIRGFIQQIQEGMRLPSYPQVALITDIMTEEHIHSLHNLSDCYVCSSRGEGWGIPPFEALAYGNKLVTTDWGGMSEFIRNEFDNEYLGWVYCVEHILQPVFGQAHGDPDLYTSRDLWAEPNLLDLEKQMKLAKKHVKLQGRPRLNRFSYEAVGEEMLLEIQAAMVEVLV